MLLKAPPARCLFLPFWEAGLFFTLPSMWKLQQSLSFGKTLKYRIFGGVFQIINCTKPLHYSPGWKIKILKWAFKKYILLNQNKGVLCIEKATLKVPNIVNSHNIDSTTTALALVPVVCSWVQENSSSNNASDKQQALLLMVNSSSGVLNKWNQSHSVKKYYQYMPLKWSRCTQTLMSVFSPIT